MINDNNLLSDLDPNINTYSETGNGTID